MIRKLLEGIPGVEHELSWDRRDTGMEDVWIVTDFYYGDEIRTYRKYWLFGPLIVKTVPKFAFTINLDILDPDVPTKVVRDKFIKAYTHWAGLLQRKLDLKNGQYI